MTGGDEPEDGGLGEYGRVLAEVDDRINRALHEADGDEFEAEERLRREDGGAPP